MEATSPFQLKKLDIEGKWFVDPSSGRVVQFRGINLGGNSKHPAGWTSENLSEAFDIDNLSFIGKPLPLEIAEEHVKRLKYWGLTFIRLLVTWEALEHKGPGVYDEEYIDYLIKLLNLFKVYGIRCFIDPHQDVWSRLCGGSGAPNWTLYLAGLDPRCFEVTQASLCHFNTSPPDTFPTMTWPTNYAKLATATMFTLFFGGATFAPNCTIKNKEGNFENIQDFFQRCYCEAYQHLFRRLKLEDLLDDVVLGLDTMNEPSEGFIETQDITTLPLISFKVVRNGLSPTPLQAMILGNGTKCDVDVYGMGLFGFVKKGSKPIDPNGVKAWLVKGESTLPNLELPAWQDWQLDANCIWAMHGVWDPITGQALKKDYFYQDSVSKRKYDYLNDFWKPFVRNIANSVRAVHQDTIMFIEPPVNDIPPNQEEGDPTKRIVYAPHWYDGKTLFKLHYSSWTFDFLGFMRGKYWFIGQALKLGERNVRKCFQEMIQMIEGEGKQAYGDVPTLIGECGIPFNMDDNKAFKDGNYTQQIKALDATLNATEIVGGFCTIWNYCYDNNHYLGDLWNREDFSIYSEATTLPNFSVDANPPLFRIPLDKGGRALEAAVRPYAMYTPGIPKFHSFVLPMYNPAKVPMYHYEFTSFSEAFLNDRFDPDKVVQRCEIYLPPHHFPPGQQLKVEVSDGHWEIVRTPLDPNPFFNEEEVNRSYASYDLEKPFVQTLVWYFSFPLPVSTIYTIKITYADTTFPATNELVFPLC